MKLKITEFPGVGGSHYIVIPVDENMPNELVELGGSSCLEVTEEEGTEILKAQGVGVHTQVRLAYMHRDKKFYK